MSEEFSDHRITKVTRNSTHSSNKGRIQPLKSNKHSLSNPFGKIEAFNNTPEYRQRMKDLIRDASNRPISKRPKRQQLYFIYKMIMNRRNFEYSLRNALRYYFNCRSSSSLNKKNKDKRDLYLNKGINKLKDDLDIVQLLKLIQNFGQSQHALFDDNEVKLMALQRRQVISSNSENSEARVSRKNSAMRSFFQSNNEKERVEFRRELVEMLN